MNKKAWLILLFVACLYIPSSYAGRVFSAYEKKVSSILHKVALGKQRILFGIKREQKPQQFVFFGKGQYKYKTIACNEGATLYFYGYIGDYKTGAKLGNFTIGICDYNKPVNLAFLAEQKKILWKSSKSLRTSIRTMNNKKAVDKLFFYDKIRLKGDTKMHYFSVFLVGHGFMTIPTAVVIPRDNSNILIMQYSHYPLCDRTKGLPLCVNPKKTMKALAIQLMK